MLAKLLFLLIFGELSTASNTKLNNSMLMQGKLSLIDVKKFDDIYCYLRNRNVDTKIVNGEEAIPHEYPYQVGIITENYNENQYLCGGSLISTKEILTAAHCLANTIRATLYFGFHNFDKASEIDGVQIIESTTFLFHPNFTNYSDINKIDLHDIAIIQLNTSVVLNNIVKTIKLDQSIVDHAGDEGIVTGWGITKFAGVPSSVLRFVKNRILSNEECIRSGQGQLQDIIKPNHICLSNEYNRGTCVGDSGGPLVSNDVQVGIAAFGPKNCNADYPTGFVRISYYVDWIKIHCGNCEFSSGSSKLSLNFAILTFLISFFIE